MCHAREGAHREHAIFGNERCASAHPSDPAAALLALGATLRTDRRELPVADLYRLPTEDDRDVTALEPGELILELEVPRPEASTYLKAMERNRFSFALVGVAAVRSGGETRLALAGVAPIPWLLSGADELDRATPLPGTAYKVDLARPLVRRALEALVKCHSSAATQSLGRRAGGRRFESVWLAEAGRFLFQPGARAGRRSGSTTCVVSRRPRGREHGATTVRCPDWERGPGASLRWGLEALPADAEAAVVVLGDGPELDPAAIDRLIAAWRERPAPVVAATYERHPAASGPARARGLAANSGRGREESRRRPRRLRRSIPSRRRRFRRSGARKLKPWSSPDP